MVAHVFGQIIFSLTLFAATATGIRVVLRAGDKAMAREADHTRRTDARVLAVVVAVVSVGVLAAVLYSWPTS